MIPNAFIGRPKAPAETDVAAALGKAKAAWDLLVVDMARELGLDAREWKCVGKKYGWSLRLMKGKRNIVHLSPCEGSFRAAIIMGDKAVKVARESRLGRAAAKLLDDAPRYPEGTGLRFEVSSEKAIPLIHKLARIKLEN